MHSRHLIKPRPYSTQTPQTAQTAQTPQPMQPAYLNTDCQTPYLNTDLIKRYHTFWHGICYGHAYAIHLIRIVIAYFDCVQREKRLVYRLCESFFGY